MLCLRDVIHLKIDLLRRLSRTSSEEWPVHIDHFIEQVETSPFRDEQALSVLLVDLAESIRSAVRDGRIAASGCQKEVSLWTMP